MSLLLKTTAAALVATLFSGAASTNSNSSPAVENPVTTKKEAKIQAAILLDVSGSMTGLIEQAKSQLWNMVTVMGKARCDGNTPTIEIALYEYGRPTNSSSQGYIRQLSPFTNDLDKLSKDLFALTTNGGDEYCGHVMYTSLTELKWDTSPKSYKVIFISGNESFLQGNVPYLKACEEAKKKGVIINTIYCGDRESGIREGWNISECGSGSYTNINHNAPVFSIPTPYDSTLYVLNTRLNHTYIGYGHYGAANVARQTQVDAEAFKSRKFERTKVKSSQNLYSNTSWDLVDAARADSTVISKVKMEELPDSLRNKNRQQLAALVKQKQQERAALQKEIAAVNVNRDAFLNEAKRKNATGNERTLESEIELMIRKQAAQFNMTVD
ncbi:MAG TPA: hypothetical protein VFZ78_04440 [Flavisolibacter sp.]